MAIVLPVVVSTLIVVSGIPALGAGYVISAKDKARASDLSQQAYTTFQAGDYTQALNLLAQADQLRPDQPDSWNLRGVILLKEKAYDKAQAAFARAIELDPDLWAAQFNLAEVAFQRRDYTRARAGFERLLTQTDRFKEASKWELVQYKAYVSCLLMGDDQAAAKKIAKLRSGTEPRRHFSMRRRRFPTAGRVRRRHRKPSRRRRRHFPPRSTISLPNSLVQVGWRAAPPSMQALASNVPAYPTGSGGAASCDRRPPGFRGGPRASSRIGGSPPRGGRLDSSYRDAGHPRPAQRAGDG